MKSFILVLLLCSSSHFTAKSDFHKAATVDLIEYNHFVDEDGREVFKQVIFYDWHPKLERFIVREWKLIKKESQIPQTTWEPTKTHNCYWISEDVMYHVKSTMLIETWTQKDPERNNRKIWKEEHRVRLFKKRKNRSVPRPQ